MPLQLRQTTTSVAFSGYGIFYNKKLLKERNLSIPTDWNSLLHPDYFNSVLMSSPSRSGSNHIMLKMLLQQRGWNEGWTDFLTLSRNFSLISSRSFNVADKVKAGLAVAGMSIDTYALNQSAHSDVGFVYFPHSIASPTFVAIHRSSEHVEDAMAFITFLLSERGQKMVAARNFAKYPLNSLDAQDSLYVGQQKLLNESLLDYDRLLAREYLVKKLFDVAITFRLAQLKEAWHALNEKEKKIGKKLTALNQNMKQQTKVSGFIIVATLLISLIFIWAFNRFYLQGHLTKRFENLIESVKLLNKGKEELPIQVLGNDEIAEINQLGAVVD